MQHQLYQCQQVTQAGLYADACMPFIVFSSL